jgi:two-component system sensor histidine kinase KdpD
LATDKNEGGVAGWVFEHGQDAGPGTDILPGAMGLYVPLKLEDEILGVLGIDVSEETEGNLAEKKTLLLALAGLSTLALNKLFLTMAAQHVKNMEASERLRGALFDSVSHELRTPLASIIGAVTSLTSSQVVYTDEQKKELLSTIDKGASRMDRLVRNLLDTARLESDSFRLKTEWCDVQDVIGVALATFGEELEGRQTVINIEEDLPLLRIDFELIVQVLVNLVDNALKYSPPGSEIEITARREAAGVVVSVEDQGPEIPTEDLDRVFDKFYRIEIPGTADGSGLGLSICKSIIDVHGGSIWAENRPGGGNRFIFSLPVAEHEPEGDAR